MEPSEIRRRVLRTLDEARRHAAVHREEVDLTSKTFDALLPEAAALWKQAAQVLKAEGFAFQVQTPANALRFVSEHSAQNFVEVALDTTRRPVAVVCRTGLVRGRHVIDRETVVAEGRAAAELEASRVLDLLLAQLQPFVER